MTTVFKLANWDIPTNSIYEDDDFKVILDASPATKGHALILPKQHYANILIRMRHLPRQQSLQEIMTPVCVAAGYNPATEQWRGGRSDSIPFPYTYHSRYESDDNKNVIEWNHKEFTDDEMKKICYEMSM